MTSAVKPILAGGYYYTPLSTASNIRVLKVEAGQESDDIICSLSETSLECEGLGTYEAMSYAWRDPKRTHHVICDGLFLGITADLHAALRTFRNLKQPRVLWADAICIDQENIDERNSQVFLMKDAYKKAQRVLIWLGERDVLDDGAYEMIKAIGPCFEKDEELSTLPPLWSCLGVFLQRP